MAHCAVGVARDVVVFFDIPGGVEIGVGFAAGGQAVLQEMAEHGGAGGGGAEAFTVFLGVEIAAWRGQVVFQEIDQRLGAGRLAEHMRVAGGDVAQVDQWMRGAELDDAVFDEVQQRVVAEGHVLVGGEVEAGVEIARQDRALDGGDRQVAGDAAEIGAAAAEGGAEQLLVDEGGAETAMREHQFGHQRRAFGVARVALRGVRGPGWRPREQGGKTAG